MFCSAKVTWFMQNASEAIECLHIKELAVKCMEGYISHQNLSDKDKEELKRNHKLWADMALKGLKLRLRECGKV